MDTSVIIFICITFVLPLLCILGDDGNWERKK